MTVLPAISVTTPAIETSDRANSNTAARAPFDSLGSPGGNDWRVATIVPCLDCGQNAPGSERYLNKERGIHGVSWLWDVGRPWERWLVSRVRAGAEVHAGSPSGVSGLHCRRGASSTLQSTAIVGFTRARPFQERDTSGALACRARNCRRGALHATPTSASDIRRDNMVAPGGIALSVAFNPVPPALALAIVGAREALRQEAAASRQPSPRPSTFPPSTPALLRRRADRLPLAHAVTSGHRLTIVAVHARNRLQPTPTAAVPPVAGGRVIRSAPRRHGGRLVEAGGLGRRRALPRRC